TPEAEPVAEDDPLAWMNQPTAEEESEEEPVAQSDTPDWLTEQGFAEETPEAEPAAEEDPMAWMHDMPVDENEEEEVAQSDMPDWLAAAHDEMAAQPEPAAEDEQALAWMTEDEQPAPAAAVTPTEAELPGEVTLVAEGQNAMSDEQQPAEDIIIKAQAAEGEALPLAEAHNEEFILGPVPPETLAEIQAQAAPLEGALEAISPLPLEPLDAVAAAPADDLPDLLVSPADATPAQPAPAEIAAEDTSLGWMDQGDAAPVAEVLPTADAQAPDWLSVSDDDEQRAAAEAVIPDWLSSYGEPDASAVAEQPVEAEVPDWMGGVSFGDEEAAVEEEAVAEAETPDWMSDMSFGDEEEAVEEEPVAEAETPDWLSEMSYETTAEAQPEPAAVDEDEEALDWMAELEEAASPSASAEGTGFDWMEPADESDAPLIAQGNTDWLTSVGISKQSAPAASTDFGDSLDWAQNADADTSSDMPGWLQEAQPTDSSSSEFDWANDLVDDTPTKPTMAGVEDFVPAGEELIPAPAENAPDWLNAMVPGLDVDPDAEEATPIEQEFVAEASGHRPHAAQEGGAPDRREFEWLTDIVDEETSAQPAAAPVVMPEQLPAAPEPKAPRMPRFSFSRLPAWLRRKSAAPAPAPAAAPVINNEEPEWLRDAEDTGDNSMDNDDVDLPDWLK
ncbi:MAG: hypothetical protein U0694_06185, partial [Anaerolineae bacterium]